MLVMGLDTALNRCSVAIIRGADVLADEVAGMERGHAERLAPMAASTLKQAGAGVRDLDRVGVVVGPGGFTGVRVALAFARGLAIGTGLPVVGVTSLAALAAAVPGKGLRAAVIDARRGQVYGAMYGSGGETIAPPFVAGPEEALKILMNCAESRPVALTGSGAALLGDAPGGWTHWGERAEIDARIVARIAAGAPAPIRPPAPLYLRAPDAKPGRPGAFEGVALP